MSIIQETLRQEVNRVGKKQLSLKKLIFVYWIVLIVIVMVLLLSYSSIIIRNSRNAILENAHTIADNYGFQLDKDITSMMDAVSSMYVDNIHYLRLSNYELDDFEWVGSAYYLQNSLKGKADAIDYMAGMFFYDQKRDSMRSLYSSYPSTATKLELDKHLKVILTEGADVQKDFRIMVCSGEYYLVYFMRSRDKYLGFAINLSRYFPKENNMEISCIYQQNQVAKISEINILEKDEILRIKAKGVSGIDREQRIISVVQLKTLDMMLVLARDSKDSLSVWKQPDLLLILILIPTLSFFFLLILLRNLNRAILYPVGYIIQRVHEMAQKDEKEYPLQPVRNVQIKEYIEINRCIDEVLEQINTIQEEKYQEKLRANNIQLQYYQLQLNPHFFLNCLNTIKSLLENHSADAADDMIISLSSYFRYIFQDRKNLVTVAEEIKEVKAYCNIYILKGGFPILLQTDVKDEVMDCRIPILCIQTFVENSVKHINKRGTILTIKIQAGIVEDESGNRRLSLRVSDNGYGYPQEMLEELNQPVTAFQYRSYHVGIDNLKYRISLIYGENANWYFYNSPYGGAITEITLPEELDEHTDY